MSGVVVEYPQYLAVGESKESRIGVPERRATGATQKRDVKWAVEAKFLPGTSGRIRAQALALGPGMEVRIS